MTLHISLCLFFMFLISQLAPQPKPMESDKAYWSSHPKLVEDFRVSSDVPLGLTIMTREVRREGGKGGRGGEGGEEGDHAIMTREVRREGGDHADCVGEEG